MRVVLVLGILWLFCGLNNYLVLKCSLLQIRSDALLNYKTIFRIHTHLTQFAFLADWFHYFIQLVFWETWKPPLYFLTGAVSMSAGVDKEVVILINNMAYMAVGLVSIYWIGRQLMSSSAGLWSAVLWALTPTVFAQSRILMVDFSVATLLALNLALALEPRFQSTGYAVLLGLATGLGLMTKRPFLLLYMPILAWLLWGAVQQGGFRSRRVFANFCLYGAVALFISFGWYGFEPKATVLQSLQFQLNEVKELSFHIQDNIDVPWFYMRRLFLYQLGPVLFIFSAVSLAYFVFTRRFFFPLSVVFLLSAHSLFTNREERFIYPILAFVMPMNGVFLASLKSGRAVISGLLGLYLLVGYLAISYWPVIPPSFSFIRKFYVVNFLTAERNYSECGLYYMVRAPARIGLGNELHETLKTFCSSLEKRPGDVNLLFLSDAELTHRFIYLTHRYSCPIEVYRPPIERLWERFDDSIDRRCDDYLALFDLIVVEGIYGSAVRADPCEMILKDRFGLLESRCQKVKVITARRSDETVTLTVYYNPSPLSDPDLQEAVKFTRAD